MKVLIVEDDTVLRENLTELLSEEGYTIDSTDLGKKAVSLTRINEYDCILLDWMLPDISGNVVCKQIRSLEIKTPIIFITAKEQVEDKIEGLDSGADDYVTKPFIIKELLARIRTVIRRNYNKSLSSIISIGDLSINTAQAEIRIKNKIVTLPPKTYAVLEFLAHNKEQIVSRSQLIEHIWDDNEDLFSNVVDSHIKKIRNLFKDIDVNFSVKTVKGKGYMLCLKK